MAVTDETVSKFQIVHLQESAEGFKTAFLLLADSCKNGSWEQRGDVMSVLGTNGMFAAELYLKLILVIESFNNSTCSGTHPHGHALDFLFNHLSQNAKDALRNEFNATNYKNGADLDTFLQNSSRQFECWRYSYNEGTISFNINTLWDVLCILKKYSSNRFISISQVIAQNGTLAVPNQSIQVFNFDDIYE